MDELIEIIKRVKPDIDTIGDQKLISDQLIDSIEFMELVSELENSYDIEIGMEYLDAEYFDTPELILKTINMLKQ